MFEHLNTLPADPILGLSQSFHQDTNPDKINLSVGVYQDSSGQTPIFSAVKKAETQLLEQQSSKAYIAQAGDDSFLEGIKRLLLGDELVDRLQDRVIGVATPGGCGAIRMLAELLVQANNKTTIWVSDPTWANHYPLLESAGLKTATYTYYDSENHCIDFDGMLDSLSQIPEGDVVLLQGSCHNPTGADLQAQQWDQIIDVISDRGIVPFIDVAYQGFGDGLIEDAYGVRACVERLPEVVIANSCSKNFGLYRERTGVAMVVTQTAEQSNAAKTHIMSAARRCYSMSPYHGQGIVGYLLSDSELTLEWKTELEQVRNRMNDLRVQLAQGLNDAQSVINFDFLAQSHGMFCYLGIPKDMVLQLRQQYAIYLLESTRINIAGLSSNNLPVLIDRIAGALTA